MAVPRSLEKGNVRELKTSMERDGLQTDLGVEAALMDRHGIN
jgi:hypothetical protein